MEKGGDFNLVTLTIMTKKTTHAFNAKAINGETPKWAKYTFRICLLLTSVATFIIASDTAIPAETAVRIGVYLKAADLVVFGLSKMIGVTIETVE